MENKPPLSPDERSQRIRNFLVDAGINLLLALIYGYGMYVAVNWFIHSGFTSEDFIHAGH